MVIFWGTVMIGQADVVAKRFWVATEFSHLMYFPLFPIGSRVVLDDRAPKEILAQVRASVGPGDEPADTDENSAEKTADKLAKGDEKKADDDEPGIPIPMSGKSVLLGYIRGCGFWLAVIFGFFGGMLWLASGDDPEAGAMYPGCLWTAGIAFALAIGSYYGPWNKAGAARARELCEAIGMDTASLPDDLKQAPDNP